MVSNELGLRASLRMYWHMTNLGSLTRRYIVIGAFDGALTIVAIVLAALASALLIGALVETKQLVIAGLGAAVGLAISSSWGAFEAERVERRRELDDLEQQMHRSMDGCMVDKAVRFATYWASFIHGASPLPAALLPLIPLLLLPYDFITAAIISVTITLAFLFILGVWMGRLAKSNSFIFGMRMVLAGLVTAAICVFIGVH
jgi:predicted membrane protein (TIGR00267 family)